MAKFTNTLHHPISVVVDGVEIAQGPGAVWEASGDEAKAWEGNHGARKATAADEEALAEQDAIRATGRNPLDDGNPSGTITSIDTPTHSDHARGLVRDNVEVAQQPTLPVTGGGELQAVPDEKAAQDRFVGDDGVGGVSHEEFQALQGAEAGDAFDGMTDDELRKWAEEDGVDLGRSSSRNGILTKIRAHEAERADAAEANAEGGSSVAGVETSGDDA